jgi:ribosomal protein L3 glutamine methyltransferase
MIDPPGGNSRHQADWLRFAVSRFSEAGLFFGHGTGNAFDEAVYLILHTLHLPLDRLDPFLDARLLPEESERLAAILDRRIRERVPAPYLTHEAWLQGYRFYVDERVIVPRSFLAPMILEHLQPWLAKPENVLERPGSVHRLRLLGHPAGGSLPGCHRGCGGSVAGCPGSSPPQRCRLWPGRKNPATSGRSVRAARRHGNPATYDLIVSNPPYVNAESVAALPPEYRHEPSLALGSGDDGLDATRAILREAARHLNPGGLLAVEIGHNRDALEAAFPDLDFAWPQVEGGEDTVFLLSREQLP